MPVFYFLNNEKKALVWTRGSQREIIYLGWLTIVTNSTLVYEPKRGGRGGGGVAGSQPMSTAVHIEPKETFEI